MSAITGIHSGVYGDQTIPWTDWREATRKRTIGRKRIDRRPGSRLSFLSQALLAILYTLAMLPFIVIGALLTPLLIAWLILAPALIAGFVLVIVSLAASAL